MLSFEDESIYVFFGVELFRYVFIYGSVVVI